VGLSDDWNAASVLLGQSNKKHDMQDPRSTLIKLLLLQMDSPSPNTPMSAKFKWDAMLKRLQDKQAALGIRPAIQPCSPLGPLPADSPMTPPKVGTGQPLKIWELFACDGGLQQTLYRTLNCFHWFYLHDSQWFAMWLKH
jgi:hypothetical protein